MAKAKLIQLPNGQVVYMETDDDTQPQDLGHHPSYVPTLPGEPVAYRSRDGDLVAKGDADPSRSEDLVDAAVERAGQMTRVIEGVAALIPTAFKNAGGAEVEKVTLSFGIKIGAQVGIPFLTKANAEGSIGVVLECRYPPHRQGRPGASGVVAGASGPVFETRTGVSVWCWPRLTPPHRRSARRTRAPRAHQAGFRPRPEDTRSLG